MRVRTASLYEGIQQRLQRLAADLKNLNEKITSGKKVSHPSDDPLAFVAPMQLKTALAQVDQYGRNLKTATSWMNLSESALSNTLNLAKRARELTVEMASDTQNAETRAAAATEVGHLLDQAISLGNTQLAGRYIFSGYMTESPSFTKVTVGGIETSQYNGDTNNFQLQIGKDETLVTGRNGQAVFMDSTLFYTLGTLKKALEGNDSAAIGAQLNSLVAVEDHLNAEIADIEARQNRVEVKGNVLSNLSNDLQERLSEVQDTDIAEVMIQLQSKQTTYQAALAVASRISEMTLLNYMR